jgi:hypothetical protein
MIGLALAVGASHFQLQGERSEMTVAACSADGSELLSATSMGTSAGFAGPLPLKPYAGLLTPYDQVQNSR